MATQAEALAQQLEAVNNELIGTVEGLSDAQWRATCAPEGWTVGVTAHHLASSHEPVAGLVMAVATGQQLPGITPEMIDAGNAQHAQQFANVGKQETLDLLRSAGPKAVGMVRGLSDEQLQRSAQLFPGTQFTAAQIAENILVGHPRQHLQSIRDAIA
jgi:uncharacterized damage-inducible protein DinB